MPVKVDIVPPPPENSKQQGVTRSLLYNGSRFHGYQKSKGNAYEVEVILQHVDEGRAFVCGYLQIHGLTDEYPTLTTFFDGEIICERHPFLTRKWEADQEVDRAHWHVDEERSFVCGYLKIHGLTDEYPTLTTFFDGEIISEKHPFLTRKWEADQDVDKKHWGRFAPFAQYAKQFSTDYFDYNTIKDTDYVFMRWKEHFLVPNHKITDISGASFAGFYYIMFQKSKGTIEGYYYHRTSE
ncbi:hypothetical protein MML48_8g00001578 [Holotrichia oblita]|uniref:Uncharacterized protein n=1 Tax=Holotrichia oblita TaxID=644536 RepID=A0ACB9SL23_HOLOL|nr:hypothetical protein MML48_8g00001578 [Holotrichia oblita]